MIRIFRRLPHPLLLLAALFLVLALFCSCSRRVVAVPAPVVLPESSVRIDTVRIIEAAVDSVTVRDSITVHERGDSVVIHHWHNETRVVYRDLLNRSASIRADTVVPVQVIDALDNSAKAIEESAKESGKPIEGLLYLLLACAFFSGIYCVIRHISRKLWK